MNSVEPYSMEIEIEADDIDVMGHVNNVVYLRWVQLVATQHWYAVANEAERTQLLWVVMRHEIDYKRPAFLGDRVLASTWVGEASGRAFERLTELHRASDGKLLAKARTLWSPVDFATKQPVDVAPEVYSRFSSNH